MEQLCRCIPCGAAESTSQSGVTATTESTPGRRDTVISPPENRGVCEKERERGKELEGEIVTQKQKKLRVIGGRRQKRQKSGGDSVRVLVLLMVW